MLPGPVVSFQAHVDLLRSFLDRRHDIVDRIQGLLNAQRQPIEYLQDGPRLSRYVEDCFFIQTHLEQSRLRGQLEAAHWARGFKPRELPGLHNGLIDPGEMMVRGFHLWRQTRWPGRNGRVHYAHTLFNLCVIRHITLLTMRIGDDGPGAGDRLSQLQTLLAHLWTSAPADQPVLVRDARWLIPLAQSPATDDLGAYFDVAEHIESLPPEDRREIHRANARMAAGHLRSQIRYYAVKKGVPLGERSLVLNTRNTNALDFALLVQDLVPLFEAYEQACRAGDARQRLDLADSICQGVSPDPELFLNRVSLLGAYSMIEHLCVTTDPQGQAAYTAMGRRHVRRLEEYQAWIDRVAKPLLDDCARFKPIGGAYSPYGLLFGFSSDLIEHMALRTLQPGAVTRFGLEDVFEGGDAGSGKLAWVNGWRQLPHIPADVARQFDYPQQFAEDVFERIEGALRTRATGAHGEARTGRLVIGTDEDPPAGSTDVVIRAEAYDERQLQADRREGRCLLSYRAPGGWVAIAKGVLTDVLAEGRDAAIAGLSPAAIDTLTLLYPSLVVRPTADASRPSPR